MNSLVVFICSPSLWWRRKILSTPTKVYFFWGPVNCFHDMFIFKHVTQLFAPPPNCLPVLAIRNVRLTDFVDIQTLYKAIFHWTILLCFDSFVSCTELNTTAKNFPMWAHKLPYTVFIFPLQKCHSTCQHHLNYEFYQPSPPTCSQNSFSFTLMPLMIFSNVVPWWFISWL